MQSNNLNGHISDKAYLLEEWNASIIINMN